MNLQTARDLLSAARDEIKSLYGERDSSDLSREIPEEVRRQRERAGARLEALEARILARPHLRPLFRNIMFDICGRDGCATEEGMMDLVDEYSSGNKNALEAISNLAGDIRKDLENQGYNITDSGGGMTGWHLGVHCTEEEANTLSAYLHNVYARALEVGMIELERKPWSLSFKP